MTGKSHKAVGMAIGFGITAWGFKHDVNQIYVIAPLLTAAGAMIPDVDHGSTKLGRHLKNIQSIILTVVLTLLFCVLGLMVWSMYHRNLWSSLLVLSAAVVIPLVVIIALSKTRMGKKLTKFSTKHRGITHTLLIPFILLIPIKFYDDYMLRLLLVCLSMGCVSHLVMDCLTKAGCPILFPITTKNISFLHITTGSVWEYVICVITIGIIAWISFAVI